MAKTLLVEDDQILVNMYQKLLQNHGHDVKIATDGEAGLKTAFEDHPDLILLDIRMPKMDGMTMLKKLRQDPWGKTTKVILLTNLDANDKILQGVIEDHPTYYLVKANNPPEMVLEKVQEILETKKGEV